MSIYNLPPQTQTHEQLPHGEINRVADIRERLGGEGAHRVVSIDDQPTGADIFYFPTHESLQAGISYIRDTEYAAVDRKLNEVNEEIAGVEEEIKCQFEHLRAIDECIDDLGLSSTLGSASRLFNGRNRTNTLRIVQALSEAKKDLRAVKQGLMEEQFTLVARIEGIEQKDMELLQLGK